MLLMHKHNRLCVLLKKPLAVKEKMVLVSLNTPVEGVLELLVFECPYVFELEVEDFDRSRQLEDVVVVIPSDDVAQVDSLILIITARVFFSVTGSPPRHNPCQTSLSL